MNLVDTLEEQALLEDLLEGSKPPLPHYIEGLHYLLATPFRYPPRAPHGSRFRSSADPGVFYGSGSVRTACAELGYWRWRFLKDAVDLQKLDPVPHTAFSVGIDTIGLDLRMPPFDVEVSAWLHPTDYAATQALARAAREAALGAIVYPSVRDNDPAWCVALLTPKAFSSANPDPAIQTWWLTVYQAETIWKRDHESLVFTWS
jgi:hypothetical protein